MGDRSRGPLTGLRVIELAGLGPAPHAAMQLADLGADVVRIERPELSEGESLLGPADHTLRSRRSVVLDLKSEAGGRRLRGLVQRADVLIEGYRPGVAERLGIGPETCLADNPSLIYARITGWGQDGPLAGKAGHDLTFLAVTGVLHTLGRAGDPPPPPLNLVADYGGGSMMLLVGILSALLERQSSGLGQVVDAAMVDGVGMLAQSLWSMHAAGTWCDDRGSNVLDGGAPFYDTYRCADGRFLAVAATEPRFYAEFLHGLGLDPANLPPQYERHEWPRVKLVIAQRLVARTRDEWMEVFRDRDACVAPVLSLAEASRDPHAVARESFIAVDGALQPRPAPRFSRTPPPLPRRPPRRGEHEVDQVMLAWDRSAALSPAMIARGTGKLATTVPPCSHPTEMAGRPAPFALSQGSAVSSRKVNTPKVIVDAAAKLFETKGYKNTTIDDIANAVGIAKPTVYQHVKGKPWLLETIHETALSEVRSSLDKIATISDPEQQIRALIEYFVAAVVRLQPYFILFYSEERELAPSTRRRFRDGARKGDADVAAIFERAQRHGLLRKDVEPEIAARLVVGMIVSIARWYQPSGQLAPEEMADRIYRILEGFVLTPPPS